MIPIPALRVPVHDAHPELALYKTAAGTWEWTTLVPTTWLGDQAFIQQRVTAFDQVWHIRYANGQN